VGVNFDYKKYLYMFLDLLELRETSKGTYKRQLKLFFRWLENRDIVKPNSEAIAAYIVYLEKKKGLSDFTICGYLTAIKLFFSWLETVNKYPDIAKKIKGPKKKNIIKKAFLNNEQVEELLKSIDRATVDGKRDYALINLMVSTGIRIIEVQQAKRGDLIDCCDFVVLWAQGKGKDFKNKHIKLEKAIFAPIYEYLDERKLSSDTEPLFASHSKKNFGQSITIRSISRIVKNRLRAIGINNKKISADSLRLTAINLKKITKIKSHPR